jgi:RHS repeat-associated protein/uncharacterized repeat protein (TIGR01451 family)
MGKPPLITRTILVLLLTLGLLTAVSLTTYSLLSQATPGLNPTGDHPVHISITDEGITPGVVTVTVNTVIVWTNNTNQTVEVAGGTVYQIFLPVILASSAENSLQVSNPLPFTAEHHALGGGWGSGPLTPGASFTYTFSLPGEYPYFLTNEPGMTAEIIVLDDEATPTPSDTPTNTPTHTATPTNTASPTPTSTPAGPPDLEIAKSDGGLIALPNDTILYSIPFTNTGGQMATGVIISDTVPEHTTFDADASSPGWAQVGTTEVYTLNVGSLPIGASSLVTFAVTMADPIPSGITTITNTVQITDDGGHGEDPTPWNNTATETTPLTTGPTEVCGSITTNTTWTRSASPYVVTCNVTVSAAVTLTIEAGTIVKFENGDSLYVNGNLLSQGSFTDLIYFTALTDDSYGGDTNGDGNSSQPTPGSWSHIAVLDGGQLFLDHTVVRYGGGYPGYATIMGESSVNADPVSLEISHSLLEFSNSYGITLIDRSSHLSTLTVRHSTIQENSGNGIATGGFYGGTAVGNVFLDSNDVLNNQGNGIEVASHEAVTVTNNTVLNHVRGIRLEAETLTITGNHVDDYTEIGLIAGAISESSTLIVNNNVITGTDGYFAQYMLNGDFTITPNTYVGTGDFGYAGTVRGQDLNFDRAESVYVLAVESSYSIGTGLILQQEATLNVEAGIVVKFPGPYNPWHNGITVNDSSLLAQGTSTEPVVFTALTDDSYGGDTNGDGNSSQPTPGSWSQIAVYDGGQLFLDHAIVRYGGGYPGYSMIMGESSVNADPISLEISHSLLEFSSSSGITLNDTGSSLSTLAVTDTTIQSNNGYGISAWGNLGNILIDGNRILGNQDTGIQVSGYQTVTVTDNVILNHIKGVRLQANTLTIIGNHIDDYAEVGLSAAATSPTSTLMVTNNIITGTTGFFAQFLLNGNFTITPNTYTGTGNLGYSGTVTGQTLDFDRVGSVYVLTVNTIFGSSGGLYLQQGATLNVAPGIVVKFPGPYYPWHSGITVNDSTLLAQGTSEEPVIFTALTDDSYGGDTNGDGNSSQPIPGSWSYIAAFDGGHLTLDHAIVRYGGGYPGYAMIMGESSVNADPVSLEIQHSLLEFSNSYGIVLIDRSSHLSTLTVTHSTIQENSGNGIATGGFYGGTAVGNVFLDSNDVLNNQGYGIEVASYEAVTVSNNTILNHARGLRVEAETLTVTANHIDDYTEIGLIAGAISESSTLIVNNNVITGTDGYFAQYMLNGNITITPNTYVGIGDFGYAGTVRGQNLNFDRAESVYVLAVESSYSVGASLILQQEATLNVAAGIVVKFPYISSPWNIGITVIDSYLLAQGTSTEPVVFTALADDSYGGDTNGDGNSSQPIPGSWSHIAVHDGGQLFLDHAIVRYGGGGYRVYELILGESYLNADPVLLQITHSLLEYSGNGGIRIWDEYYPYMEGTLLVSDSTIRSNLGTGILAANIEYGLLRHNNIFQNGSGVYANPAGILDARYNYWGSEDGPAPYGSGDSINTFQEWEPVCQCYITRPAVLFSPWLDAAGNVVGTPPPISNGSLSTPWATWTADPVNVVFGNYVYQYTDLAFPTQGEDIAFQRSYNSANQAVGPLGPGWTHSYHITVTQSSPNTVIVQREDGRLDLYTDDTTGNYLPPPGIYDTLTWNNDHFELTRKEQVVYVFNPDGSLDYMADPNGNTTSFSYGGGHLLSLTEPTGRQLSFTYNGSGLLRRINDPDGRSVQFGYSGGRLTTVTDVNGRTTTYAYEGNGRLQSITDANGHTFVQNVYDGDGRVSQQRDALNHLTTFAYDTDNRQTTVTDPRNFATVYEYDSAYRVIAETDPLGNTTIYAFDAHNNRTQVTDKRGHSTHYTYDGRGNVLTITDPLAEVTTFSYDNYNNLLSETDRQSHTTTYQYDSNHNLTQMTDALNHVTTWAYGMDGLVQSSTDANNHTTTFAYDVYGYPQIITNALSYITVYAYDVVGRLLSETDADGRTTSYSYDNANRLLTLTNPLGGIESYTYDMVGNRTSFTDPRGGVTTFVYDAKDRLASTTDALGHTTSQSYDAVNNLLAITNPLNHTTSYSYDALNRRTSATDPLNHTTTFAYDADGNRTALTDANGQTTTYTYDARNQLLAVTDAAAGSVTYTYDANGNRTALTDANNHITSYAYDALNRLLSVTDPLNYSTSYTYDAVGNRLSKTKADNTTLTYSYDALNRLTTTGYPGGTITYAYDAVGNRLSLADSVGTTSYVYDALNRVTAVTGPTGSLNYSYDPNGNRTSLTYPNSQSVSYVYDLANRLTTATDWSGRITTYTYDNANRQTGIHYPNNIQATYTYDNADRLLSLVHTHPSNGTIASFNYTLDAVGNRLTMQDLEGTTSYSYDDLYRLTQVVYPNSETVTYSYDPMGNRLSMNSTVHGLTAYTYDVGDRLLTAGTTAFTWDANGNMTGKGNGVYTFDALDRLTQVVSGTTAVQFAYDGDGGRLQKTVNGILTSYVQDMAAPLPVVLVETTAGQSNRYLYGNDLTTQINQAGTATFYHTDGLGSTRALSNLPGQRTDAYSYDVFGAVRLHTGTASQPFTFTGEQADIETNLVFLRARYYDPQVGRFISKDSFPGFDIASQSLNRYTYSTNNPINASDPSGHFNLRQFGAGALDMLSGVGTVGTSIAAGTVATGLCATVVGCVVGGPLAVYAVNQAAVGGQKIGYGAVEIGMGIAGSSTDPVERFEAYDPLGEALGMGGAALAPSIGLSAEEGRIVGETSKLLLDISVSFALGTKSDAIAYGLWQGGIVHGTSTARMITPFLNNPLLKFAGNVSRLEKIWGLFSSRPVTNVYAPGLYTVGNDGSWGGPPGAAK